MLPESNLEFVGIRHGGIMQSYRLNDLILRELDELLKWLLERYNEGQEHHYKP